MSKQTNITISQQGFTLVELSIVLVIIGLVVSSVLVGQDLIKAATLRATVRQLNEFQVGVNTFIGKYNGIPGDISNGITFDAGWTNGDGNGTLTDANAATTVQAHTGEMATFWKALTTSGKEAISGTYAGIGCTTACAVGKEIPATKTGAAGWGVFGVSGVNYFVLGANFTTTNSNYIITSVLTPLDAFNIDEKIDDGLPSSGNVLGAAGVGTSATVFSTPAAGSCMGTTYTVTGATVACGLEFVMQTF